MKSFLLKRFSFKILKINTNVYDLINSLNKNLKTEIVWYPEKETRSDIETNNAINRVLSKEHFYEKSMQKLCTKSWI